MCMHVKRVLIHLYGTRDKVADHKGLARVVELCRNYLEVSLSDFFRPSLFWDIFYSFFQVYMTVDSGYSTWRGKLMEAMVGPYLQLHKLAMAEGKITRCDH